MRPYLKVCLLFQIMVGFVFQIHAQSSNPGYLGKKNMVSVNTHYGFSYGRSNMEFVNQVKTREVFFTPDFQYEISALHSMNKKLAIGLCAGRYSSSFEMGGFDRMNIHASSDVLIELDGNEMALREITGFGLVKATTIGLLMKRYRPEYGALAPIGGYYTFRINTNFLNVDMGNIRATGESSFLTKYYALYTNRSIVRMNFIFGFGSSKAFLKRWVSDFGINFRLLHTQLAAYGMNQATISEQKFIDSAVRIRQNWFDNVLLHYSLGYLL